MNSPRPERVGINRKQIMTRYKSRSIKPTCGNKIYPENSIILAPLSGFSDLPYRESAYRYGCNFAFTEMVDAGAVAFRNPKTLKMLSRGENEKWLGVQVVGSDLDHLKRGIEVINQYDFNVLDFNLGCPAPKVTRKGEGSKLAETPDKAAKALDVIVSTSKIPVTAKIRILNETDPKPTISLAKKLRDSGAKTITIHGRLRKNYYAGPVFHDIIKEVKDALDIDIIANGGVNNYDDYCETRKKTTCDKVMIARGAMGNPWIFNEILNNNEWQPPTPNELADEVNSHIMAMINFYGEELGLKISRKIILDYMRGRGFPRILKTEVITIKNSDELNIFTDKLSLGPSERYSIWLKTNLDATRRLSI